MLNERLKRSKPGIYWLKTIQSSLMRTTGTNSLQPVLKGLVNDQF